MYTYTLRDIPESLHNTWKASAALKSETMRDYCFRSIANQVARDLKKTSKEDFDGYKKHGKGRA